MIKKLLAVCMLFTVTALFITVSVMASRQLLFSSQPSPLNLTRYGVFTKTILDDPPIRAGAKVRDPLIAIGDEVEVVVLIRYLEGEISITNDKLKNISFNDPFEVKTVWVGRGDGPDGNDEFVVVTYHIQCVSCIPGFSYPINPLHIEIPSSRGTIVRKDIEVSPNLIAVDFRYNQNYPGLRGIKTSEKLETHHVRGFWFMGGGMIMGIVGMVWGGLDVLRRVIRRKRTVEDSPLERLRVSFSSIERRLRDEEDVDTRTITHELYIFLCRFVYQTYGVDVMREDTTLPSGIPQSLRDALSLCEGSYSCMPFRREGTETFLKLVRDTILWYDSGEEVYE